MVGANPARTLYGLSPYADSVRTQTAHFVSHTSAYVPIRRLLPAHSLRTRGFIRGSIPLSSTIKRLVRLGPDKANGQKPKMYGHADRIDGQGKGSGKLPVLLDCCVLLAYSCPMTTSESATAQRDELALDVMNAYYEASDGTGSRHWGEMANILASAGYRKPRTITTVEELDALPDGAVLRDAHRDIIEVLGGKWYCGDFHGRRPTLPATILHASEAEVGA